MFIKWYLLEMPQSYIAILKVSLSLQIIAIINIRTTVYHVHICRWNSKPMLAGYQACLDALEAREAQGMAEAAITGVSRSHLLSASQGQRVAGASCSHESQAQRTHVIHLTQESLAEDSRETVTQFSPEERLWFPTSGI